MDSIVNIISKIDLNLFSIVLLAFVLISIKQKKGKTYEDNIIFILGLSTFVLLILDSVAWSIDGLNGPVFKPANMYINIIISILNPVPLFIWSVYAYYLVRQERTLTKRFLIKAGSPILIITALAVTNPYTGLFFTIDSSNIYHRGTAFFILPVLNYSYLIYSIVFITLNRKNLDTALLRSLLLCIIIPLIAASMQIFFYGTTLFFPGLAVSILILYILVQNSKLTTDYLTGLGNRRSFDEYITHCFDNERDDKPFGAIMMDIDDFKIINDSLGHRIGDEVLEQTAALLRNSLRKNDFIARYAGDEFVAIIRPANAKLMDKTVKRIEKAVKSFNEISGRPYKISISIGYGLCRKEEWKTIDGFFKEIDGQMYYNKRLKSTGKKRASAAG